MYVQILKFCRLRILENDGKAAHLHVSLSVACLSPTLCDHKLGRDKKRRRRMRLPSEELSVKRYNAKQIGGTLAVGRPNVLPTYDDTEKFFLYFLTRLRVVFPAFWAFMDDAPVHFYP